ncbi:MAG TPA: sigma-70 family RNA polymerase sigma factor [Streptosporangiaceae bacterium]|nr:sigma-70 family RNA polymerase sigma factor [Streptosporangiaceae bacterium]
MTDPYRVTSTSSDAELISAARSGDERAFGLLRERHARSALRLARLLTPSPAEAGDAVVETLARVLDAIRRGAGPSEAFRPYLLTAIRRATLDRVHSQHSQLPPGAEIATPGALSVDVIGASLERSLTVKAFRALPERWAAVLWHAEVERARPAELALLLGTSADEVAQLAERAREGLRQAYLQIYLSVRAQAECRQVAGKLPDYARNRLSQHEQLRVIGHLTRCPACSTAHAELAGIDDGLRGMVARAVLGEQVTGYLGQDSAVAAGARARLRWMRAVILRRPVLPVVACIAVAAIGLPTMSFLVRHLLSPPLSPRIAPPAAVGPLGGPGPDIGETGAAGPASRASSMRGTPLPGSRAPQPHRSSSVSAAPSPTGSVTAAPTSSPLPTTLRSGGVAASAKLRVSIVVSGLLS